MKSLIILMLCTILNIASAQNTPVGIFQANSDIGNPKKTGSAVYDKTDQSYTLKGAGYNIWFERDEFHYLFNKIKGDFILTANFEFVGKGTNPHRKSGWMVRETTDAKSSHISATLHGSGLTVLQWRVSSGVAMRDPQDEIFAKDSSFNVIQIERTGKNIIMRAAHSGKPFETIGSHVMENMPDEVLVGPFICSHYSTVTESVKICNVRIDKPVAD
jgi:TolB protein